MEKLLYTPSEIIQRNPVLSKKNWTAQRVGQLFAMQLVSGVNAGRVVLIDEDDVLRLFFFRFPSLMHPTPLV